MNVWCCGQYFLLILCYIARHPIEDYRLDIAVHVFSIKDLESNRVHPLGKNLPQGLYKNILSILNCYVVLIF